MQDDTHMAGASGSCPEACRSKDGVVVDDAALAEFCGATGASTEEAYWHLQERDGNLQKAVDAFLGLDVYGISCPYTDCRRLYEVRRDDFRCRNVRCGGVIYGGKFWQFPPHATREEIRAWLLANVCE